MVDLDQILRAVADGELNVAEARNQLEGFTRVSDFARLDTTREGRKSIPEVVLCDGKSSDQIIEIAQSFLTEANRVLLSRVDDETRSKLQALEADTE